jgi:N-acyl-L-homoserine lactone synthetase
VAAREVQRSVKCSLTYQHDKQKLARILMSAIRKAESTRFRTVSVITHERLYVTLNAAGWRWARFQHAGAARYTIL